MSNHSKKQLKVIEGFSDEWDRIDQSKISLVEQKKLFNRYFSIFHWKILSEKSIGFDLGCGSGRWAMLIAPKVKETFGVLSESAADDV